MIKPVFRLLPLAFVIVACDSEKKSTSASKPPKAEIVEEDTPSTPGTPEAASEPGLKALPVPEENTPPPRAIAVSEDEAAASATTPPSSSRQPRARTLSKTAEKVGQGIQTAGRKTEEAAIVAEEHTKDAVEIAKEKTETGLRNAASATGRFFQRAGEKIEEAAKDAQHPEQPSR